MVGKPFHLYLCRLIDDELLEESLPFVRHAIQPEHGVKHNPQQRNINITRRRGIRASEYGKTLPIGTAIRGGECPVFFGAKRVSAVLWAWHPPNVSLASSQTPLFRPTKTKLFSIVHQSHRILPQRISFSTRGRGAQYQWVPIEDRQARQCLKLWRGGSALVMAPSKRPVR